MKHMAWYRYPSFDPSLPRKIKETCDQMKKRKERDVKSGLRLSYIYERERFVSRNGRGYTMPHWVLEQCGWLADIDMAAPRLNLIKSRCDFLNIQLFNNQGNFGIESGNAGFEETMIAEARMSALEGAMNTTEIKQMLEQAGLIGLIENFIAATTVIRNDEPQIHLIKLENLYWDSRDAKYGDPKSMHWVEYMDKKDCVEWYSGFDAQAMNIKRHGQRLKKIEELKPVETVRELDGVLDPYDYEDEQIYGCIDSTERLRVVHSYRVSTSPLNEDGRYICSVYGANGEVLAIDTIYPRSKLPIVWWSPYPAKQGGIVGSGYAVLLLEIQRALDFSMARAQNRMEKMGWAKVGLPMSVNEEVIENYVAEEITAVRLPGTTAPFLFEANPISEGDMMWIDGLINRSSQLYGVNQAIASGGSDSGANASAVSKYEDTDRQIDRFTDIYHSWRLFRLRLAEEMLNTIEDAVRVDPDFATHYQDEDGTLIKYDWADVSLPNSQFKLKIEESGIKNRKVRIEQILDGLKMGLFDPAQANTFMMQDPDIRKLNRLTTAARKAIEKDLTDLINPKGNHDVQPTEDYDLQLAVILTGQVINDAYARRAKPETIERLREYRRAAESLLQIKMAEQQTQQVAAAAATQASGDLIQSSTDQQASMMTNRNI